MSKQHDAPESRAAMEKRLGIAAEEKKAAADYANKGNRGPVGTVMCKLDFLCGVRWERRRRARRGG